MKRRGFPVLLLKAWHPGRLYWLYRCDVLIQGKLYTANGRSQRSVLKAIGDFVRRKRWVRQVVPPSPQPECGIVQEVRFL